MNKQLEVLDFNDIVKNKEYRERVIKYFRLPIRLSVSFEKFMSDLEFIKNTNVEKYNRIIELTEKDFNKVSKEQETKTPDFTMVDVIEPIVSQFEESDEWKKFTQIDYSDVLKDYKGITSPHGFYIKENDGKHFISIDLKSANWQSLQSIIGFNESFEDVIKRHSRDLIIPPTSKAFRVKITGLLGAKEIGLYNKYLLKTNKDKIFQALYDETGIDIRKKVIFAFYADEILIELDKESLENLKSLDLYELERVIYNKTNIKVHLRPFTLKWLDINKACVKLFKDGEYELLNISKDIAMIFNKLEFGLEPKDIDFEKIKLKSESREEYIKKVSDTLNKFKQELN